MGEKIITDGDCRWLYENAAMESEPKINRKQTIKGKKSGKKLLTDKKKREKQKDTSGECWERLLSRDVLVTAADDDYD